MSTACFDLARSIPLRVSELSALIKSAQKEEEKEENEESKDEALYNALCRATCVLLSSHLESFLKDLSSSLTQDLTYHLGTFDKMPAAMRRTFCTKIAYFEGATVKDMEGRVKQLESFFSKNSVVIDMKAFTYKESENKNPGASVIDTTLSKIGVPSVLSSISIPSFEVVFEGNLHSGYLLNRDMVRFCANLYKFPFKPIPAPYETLLAKNHKQSQGQSLWYTFIEQILQRRHRVAHGESMSNETTWEQLQRDTEKMKIMMYALLYASASYLGSPR